MAAANNITGGFGSFTVNGGAQSDGDRRLPRRCE
jgi:hypothetical protein